MATGGLRVIRVCISAVRYAIRHPTEGASRTPPPTVGWKSAAGCKPAKHAVGCIPATGNKSGKQWRTGDGAPYGVGTGQQPVAWSGKRGVEDGAR